MRGLLSSRGLLFIDIVDFRAAYLRNWSVEDAVKIDHPYYLTQETMTAAILYAKDHEDEAKATLVEHLELTPEQAQAQIIPTNYVPEINLD